ncbi:MAG: hypothetical protein UY18_C0050G0019 [Microgenomates group bacterium GW2011_GWF2_47_9]|nr:MAG: hypothetical protein UY18_C0050G0019 [Microgenomates group bacterium GW2011_GWF2_47_9]
MAIVEYQRTVTHESLMKKSKHELVSECISLLDFCWAKEQKRQQYEDKLRALLEALECQKVEELVQRCPAEMLSEIGKKIAIAAKIGGKVLDLS